MKENKAHNFIFTVSLRILRDLYEVIGTLGFYATRKKVWLFVEAHDSEDFAEDSAVIYYDGIHCVVFRLETDMAVLLVECLDCCRIIDESNNLITIFSCIANLNKYLVTIKNAGIDH